MSAFSDLPVPGVSSNTSQNKPFYVNFKTGLPSIPNEQELDLQSL